MYTRKVNENLTQCTPQKKQQKDNDLFATAAVRPNSSGSSSTQQRRRRGSGGGQQRASEPPIVRLMTPCVGGCALVYASTRGVHTHNESLNTLHIAEETTPQRLFAAATDRPNSSSSGGDPAAGAATYDRATSYRPFDNFVPWSLRVVWDCHVCSVFVGCVASCVLCESVGCFLQRYVHTWSCM